MPCFGAGTLDGVDGWLASDWIGTGACGLADDGLQGAWKALALVGPWY